AGPGAHGLVIRAAFAIAAGPDTAHRGRIAHRRMEGSGRTDDDRAGRHAAHDGEAHRRRLSRRSGAARPGAPCAGSERAGTFLGRLNGRAEANESRPAGAGRLSVSCSREAQARGRRMALRMRRSTTAPMNATKIVPAMPANG